MENLSTRRFFNSEFVIKYKLSFSLVILLQDIYFWLLSEKPPKKIILNNKTFYFISQSHFVRLNYGLLSQGSVNEMFSKLKEIGIIESSFVHNYTENYINFNWSKIKESLLPDKELQNMENEPWWKRIHAYADEQIKLEQSNENTTVYDNDYEIVKKGNRNYLVKKENKESGSKSYNKPEESNMLFNASENKITYSENSYRIATRIIEKCKNEHLSFFNHKYNSYGENQTKLFNKSCNFVESIYKGKFINPRLYPLSDKFKNNQQFPFDFDCINQKLKEVEGDWIKVKKLILSSLNNFILMHQDEFVPCDKQYLVSSLSDWFYGYSDEAGKYQSQFLLSFNEPMKTPEFYSEKKADKIYESLSNKVKENGNKLIELLPKGTPSGKYWQNVKEIVEWAKLVLTSDENARYWIENPADILNKLYDYFTSSNIQVSNNTLNIRKQINCSGPWVWFVQQAIENHSLNRNLVDCVTSDDFLDCYKSNITYNDTQEVIF